jgi:hypothetical protein
VYAWILKSMKDVEPRWDMSKLRIIFGDQHEVIITIYTTKFGQKAFANTLKASSIT